MKIGDKDYQTQLDTFLHDEFLKEERKPQGMYGYWAWAMQKTRDFNKMLREQRKLEE